jgi:ABC-2 type transport system ATP-binding protein
VLIAAGRVLDDAGIELEDLGIRRPSLDDVFLAITGHPAAPGDAGQAPHSPGAGQ